MTSTSTKSTLQYDEEDFETYEVSLLSECVKEYSSNLKFLHEDVDEESESPDDPLKIY